MMVVYFFVASVVLGLEFHQGGVVEVVAGNGVAVFGGGVEVIDRFVEKVGLVPRQAVLGVEFGLPFVAAVDVDGVEVDIGVARYGVLAAGRPVYHGRLCGIDTAREIDEPCGRFERCFFLIVITFSKSVPHGQTQDTDNPYGNGFLLTYLHDF